MPRDTPQAKSKGGKILGMPAWAAGLALVLGLVAGYYLLRKSGGQSGDQSQSSQTQKPADDQGGGAGGAAVMPSDMMRALGIAPPGGYQATSEGSTNGDTSNQSAVNPQATFDAAVNYAHGQFAQGGAPLNQPAVTIAHQQINTTPTIAPSTLSYAHGVLHP